MKKENEYYKSNECQELRNILVRKIDKKEFTDRIDDTVNEAIDILMHYAENLNCAPADVCKALEERRRLSIANYYNKSNFPDFKTMHVFETKSDAIDRIKPHLGFRCPACKGVSTNPYDCDTGKRIDKKICNWKSYGLFRADFILFIKKDFLKNLIIDWIFTPISYEKTGLK